MLAAAEAQVSARGTDGPLVWAAAKGWHPGVVGIVAARLKEAFGRPAIVIGFDGAEGKGSGRSVAGVDLGAAIARLSHEGLILRGGGHRMAAGLTLLPGQVESAMARLSELLAVQGAGSDPAAVLRIDGLVAPSAATVSLAQSLAAVGPFGAGAPAPLLAVTGRIAGIRQIGTNHLALAVADRAGGRLEAIAFRAADGPIGALLSTEVGSVVHLAGRLEADTFAGRTRAKLHVEDAAKATKA